MKSWKIAWLNIRRNLLISCLLIFSMSLALGTMGLLYRIESLQTQRWTQMAEWAPVIVGPKQGGIDLLLSTGLLEVKNLDLIPYRLFETLRAKQEIRFEDKSSVNNDNIELAVPLLMMGKAQEHWVVGSDLSMKTLLFKNGFSFLEKGEWFQTDRELVIGQHMARRLNKTVGDRIEVSLLGPRGEPLNSVTQLKISGVLPETLTAWDEAAIGDLHLGWQVYSKLDPNKVSIWGAQVLHYFWLRPAPGALDGLRSLINQRSVAQMADTATEKARLNELLGQSQELSLLVSGLILLICFVVILALMIMRFQNQAPQMATLRAIGFSDKRLLNWMLFEAGFLLVGSLLLSLFWAQIFWWVTSYLMRDSVTFLTSHWITPQWEWPVWLCGSLAFALSLIGPWILILKDDLHEKLRV
jgi:predicted lysophospholipase L1 biosynthesis ABC-type transport system permease subunit